jgi:hypothetical protein
MSKEIENVNEVTEVEEVKESKVKKMASNAGAAVKKHGKKVVIGIAAIGAVILGARAIMKKSANGGSCTDDCDCVVDDDNDVEEN